MTKDQYFEMCEMMNTEPVEADIPVEFVDLASITQDTMELYSYLPDRWEGMSGVFMGKDYNIVFELFNVHDITSKPEQRLMLKIMSTIDKIRSDIIAKKQKERDNKKPSS
jgi:hypothetical protein